MEKIKEPLQSENLRRNIQRRNASVNLSGGQSYEEHDRALEQAASTSAFTADMLFNTNWVRDTINNLDRMSKYENDPTFNFSKDYLPIMRDKVPVEYLDQFSKVTSYPEMMDLYKEVQRITGNRTLLSNMGFRGVTAQLLGSMLDADALLMLTPGGTYLGARAAVLATKAVGAGKIASIATGAVTGLEASSIAELANYAASPAYNIEDVPSAILGGIVFGSGLGTITRMDKLANASMKLASESKIKYPEKEGTVTDYSVEVGPVKIDTSTAVPKDTRATSKATSKATSDILPNGKIKSGNYGSLSAGAANPSKVLELSEVTHNLRKKAWIWLTNAQVHHRKVELDAEQGISQKFFRSLNKVVKHIPGVESGYNRLAKSKSQISQYLAHALYSDPSGEFRYVVNGAKNDIMYKSQILQKTFADTADEMKEYLHRNKIKRTVDTEESFRKLVNRELDDRRAGDLPERVVDPAVTTVANAYDRSYKRGLDIQKGKEGETPVWGAEHITHEAGWRPFTWTYQNVQKLLKNKDIPLTVQMIEDTLTGAYSKMYPTWSRKAARQTARGLYRRMKSLDTSGDMSLAAMLQGEGEHFIRERFTDWNIPKSEIDSMINSLKGIGRKEERGKVAGLKHRNDLDPRTPIKGTPYTLADLMSSDIESTLHNYARRASGASALARQGIQKIDKSSIIDSIEEELLAEGVDVLTINRTKQDVEDLFQAFSGGAFAGGINPWVRRALLTTNLAVLNALGLTQLAETGVIISAVGIEAFMETLPAAIKTSWLKGEYSPAMQQLGDASHFIYGEQRMSRPQYNLDLTRRAANLDTEAMDALDKLGLKIDSLLIKGQHLQGYMSGFYKIKQLQQDIFARAYMQKLGKIARGELTLSDRRLYDMGLDEAALSNILHNFREHVEYKDGLVYNLHPDKWKDADWEAFNASHIEVSNQAIQLALKGEDSPVLHENAGAILGHLKSFPLLAVSKQLIREGRMGDTQAMMSFTYSMIFAGIAYSAKQVAAGRTDHLTPEKIARGAFGLSNITSPIPMFADPLGALLGMNTNFSGYTRPGGAGPNILPGMPAYDVINRMGHIPEALLSTITGNADIQDISALQVLPIIGNAAGISAGFNAAKDHIRATRRKERRIERRAKALAKAQATKQTATKQQSTQSNLSNQPIGTQSTKGLGEVIDKATQITGGGN